MPEELGPIYTSLGELKGSMQGLKDLMEQAQETNGRNFKNLWDLHNEKIAPTIAQIPAMQKAIEDNKTTAANGLKDHLEGHNGFRKAISIPIILGFGKIVWDTVVDYLSKKGAGS